MLPLRKETKSQFTQKKPKVDQMLPTLRKREIWGWVSDLFLFGLETMVDLGDFFFFFLKNCWSSVVASVVLPQLCNLHFFFELCRR